MNVTANVIRHRPRAALVDRPNDFGNLIGLDLAGQAISTERVRYLV